jgi:tRNA threonylcarbamoyladenosine biosynthesis protein TsaB
MSWILGLDTSSPQLSLALMHNGAMVSSYSRYPRNSHAEHIAPAIDFMLNAGTIDADKIVAAGIVVGPGSFTGLRIGISFIKGLFFNRLVRIVPVSSLECIAQAWPCANGTITVALDARKDAVFWAQFSVCKGTVTRLTTDALDPVERLDTIVPDHGILLCDTQGYAKSTVFSKIDPHGRCTRFHLEQYPVDRGRGAAYIALQRMNREADCVDPQQLLPSYLQESYADILMRNGANSGGNPC